MSEYPKVLIITPECFGGNSSSAILLNNIFRGWPKENLAQIFLSGNDPDFGQCLSFWKFPNNKFLYNNGHEVKQIVATGGKMDSATYIKRPRWAKKNLYLEPVIDLFPLHQSKNFQKWVNEFAPDVIYSWLGCKRMIKLTNSITKNKGIPLVVHFMDNWLLASPYTNVFLKYLHRYNIQSSFSSIRPRISMGLAISKKMAEEYFKIIKKPFEVVCNGVDNVFIDRRFDIKSSKAFADNSRRKYTFAIMGRLEYGRIKILQNLASFLEASSEYDIDLKIYSDSDVSGFFEQFHKIKVFDLAPPNDDEFPNVNRTIDCYLYIDDFEEVNSEFFRFSFSGKIPLYIASGKPVLTIGPEENYSVSFLKECNVGPVVTSFNKADLAKGVQNVFSYNQEDLSNIETRSHEIISNFLSQHIQHKKLQSVVVGLTEQFI